MSKKNLIVLLTLLLMAMFVSACGDSSDQNDKADNKDKATNEKSNSNDDAGNNKNESNEQDNEDPAENPETNDTELTEAYISEIADFNDKERRDHHEKLADRPPEQVKDKVYEHLMLPGVHENTQTYEGRINPGESVRFNYFNEEGSQQFMDDPDVSKDGYFTINLDSFDLKEGQEIEVAITGGYPEQQNFILTVNEAQEGMENIRVK